MLNRDHIVCTDLYSGLSLDKIIKISKLAHLFVGADEDLHQDYFILTLLGIDNYLRSYMYLYGKWQPVSPLSLGIKRLQAIGKNLGFQYFRELKIKENMLIPCISGREWLTCVPMNADFMAFVNKYDELRRILNG